MRPVESSRIAPFTLLLFLVACGSETTTPEGDQDVCAEPPCEAEQDVRQVTDARTSDVTEEVAEEVEEDTSDVGEELDAGEPDADVATDIEEETPDVATDVTVDTGLRATITAPSDRSGFRAGDEVTFEGTVLLDGAPATAAIVQWYSDREGFLDDAPPTADGSVSFTTDILAPGEHIVTLEAEIPGVGTVTDAVTVGICGFPEAFTFDTDLPPGEWEVIGDASRDSRGWLEMTQNIRDRRGAILYTGNPISQGDIRIRFDISTGQCNDPGVCSSSATGADGFAVSIIETSTVDDVRGILERAQGGGGLGYGVSGGYGTEDITAFHIEFDTWYNQLNDAEYHTDPTTENHIGITLNGDPGNHILWAALPNLEDNNWHSVAIDVIGSTVTVRFDDVVVAEEEVEGLIFKGGWLAFTGVTGYYSNYHRFDNLVITEACELR